MFHPRVSSLTLLFLLATCAREQIPPMDPKEVFSGGTFTVREDSTRAFARPGPGLSNLDQRAFFVGNAFFNDIWVQAPASAAGRDGLGPHFNATSCSGCHFRDGRGRPALEEGGAHQGFLVRLSVREGNAFLPHVAYGGQIQDHAIAGVPKEADVVVSFHPERTVLFADGEVSELVAPRIRFVNLGYGELEQNVLTSARVAPAVFGLGLLEAIPEERLHSLADPEDSNKDGISGRVNLVKNVETKSLKVGRFGWKANQPSIRQQSAGAFLGDMGITSPVFPKEDCTRSQTDCKKAPSGNRAPGMPELSEHKLKRVTEYLQLIAPPMARTTRDHEKGRALFYQARCTSCHTPTHLTSDKEHIHKKLRNQTIYPYTDLLLHDMGEGLADNRPDGLANGREWRTPPLWGIGLVKKVNGHTRFLHDGRARNVQEAILWHGGEATSSRNAYVALSKKERTLLLRWLDSI